MKSTRVLFRFLVGYLTLHLLMAGLFVVVLTQATRNHLIGSAQNELRTLALILREHVDQLPDQLHDASLVNHVEQIGERKTGFRFTVIDSDGNVLVDSETGTRPIGPHADRPEVLDARQEGIGFAERSSKTLEKKMMYLAIPFHSSSGTRSTGESTQPDGFIRVSTPMLAIDQSISNLQRTIWLFALLVLGLTGLLMYFFSSRAMQPLQQFAEAARRVGEGELDQPVRLSRRDDEWQQLADAFGQMQDMLADRENNLVENNQRVQAVLSSMIEGVLSTASDGSVLMANDAACEMLSLDRSELIGRKLLDVIRFPEFRKAIERARENRSFSESEFEVFERPRRLVKARVSTLSNDPELGVAIVLHDVTEIRALENMRRDFVANVSHELKTPLSSIKAYSETLRLGAVHDADRALPFIEQIESQAEVLNLQIQDLIELARIESGKAGSDITSIKINQICSHCVHQLQSQAEQRNVNLTYAGSDDDVVGRANHDGITTIVNNLVSNAIHYTPAGGRVVVRTRTEGTAAIIEVADTGIGIAPDQQARVFERFYRVDKARSRDLGGTGLGLSIVKHLAQSFSGSVHLSSQIGKGSTFQVRIPRAN